MSETPSRRVALLLDQSRALLAGLSASAGGSQANVPRACAVASARLVWAGRWLDEPYVPDAEGVARPVAAANARDGLRRLADAFEALVESLEDEDPVANANGVQAGSLAFAIVSATAAFLERQEGARGAR